MEKHNIKIIIGGRSYKYLLSPDMEETVRAAAKRIDSRLSSVKEKYREKDMQDILTIVLLEYMIKLIRLESNSETEQLMEELQSLDKKLGEYIISR